jgi:hypothetical protein
METRVYKPLFLRKALEITPLSDSIVRSIRCNLVSHSAALRLDIAKQLPNWS